MRRQLLATKPLALLLEEMRGENRLRRILGPIQLTSLGVGAIIGTGIFVLTGEAAHDNAGPGADPLVRGRRHRLRLRRAVLRGVRLDGPGGRLGVHVRLRDLGELFAWIIGWDLVLEYTVVSATVAHGWSAYFQDFIGIFGWHVPHAMTRAPFDYSPEIGQDRQPRARYSTCPRS